jgi:hypothetical protein
MKVIYMTMEERGKSKWLGNFYQSTRHHVEELTKLLISLHPIPNSIFLNTPYDKSDLNVVELVTRKPRISVETACNRVNSITSNVTDTL